MFDLLVIQRCQLLLLLLLLHHLLLMFKPVLELPLNGLYLILKRVVHLSWGYRTHSLVVILIHHLVLLHLLLLMQVLKETPLVHAYSMLAL